MQVTIKTKRRDRKGVCDTNDVWYSSMKELPETSAGDIVELVGYNKVEKNGNVYHNIKGLKVIQSAREEYKKNNPGYTPAKSKGYDTNTMIVRQNALTNACNLIANGIFKAKSPSDVLALMEELAAGVLKEGQEASKPTTKTEPKKAKEVAKEEPPFDVDEDDSEDAFEL